MSAGLACWPELGGLGLSGDWVAVKRQPKIYIATQTELLCKRCILQQQGKKKRHTHVYIFTPNNATDKIGLKEGGRVSLKGNSVGGKHNDRLNRGQRSFQPLLPSTCYCEIAP